MQAGYARWGMVTVDSPGVPHGGPFGNVDDFCARAEQHGLKIGWSREGQHFVVYIENGPGRYVPQMQLYRPKTDEPIPMTDKLLWLLLYCRERHFTMGGAGIVREVERLAKEAKAQKAKEEYEQTSALVTEATNDVFRHKGRPLISIPRYVSAGGRHDN